MRGVTGLVAFCQRFRRLTPGSAGGPPPLGAARVGESRPGRAGRMRVSTGAVSVQMGSPGSPDEVGTAASTTDFAARAFPTPRPDSEQAEHQAGHSEDIDADSVIASRFIAGDAGALAEVYRQTSPLVFTIALRTLASEADAEDVTQHVYLRAWRSRRTYEAMRPPLRAWLVEMTRHLVADRMADWSRQHRLDQKMGEVDWLEQESEDGIAERVADALVVADAMSRLDHPRRQVVEMSFFDGFTHTQISEQLGIPVDTVKSHIKRGLGQLRRQLGVVSDAAS